VNDFVPRTMGQLYPAISSQLSAVSYQQSAISFQLSAVSPRKKRNPPHFWEGLSHCYAFSNVQILQQFADR
jgi:hypothetical protein